ncbi:P-loop containing nucleoside triphosphate hydrolase protein [Staphylotrichum tortipilum]|uniref:P-loop containing nucleoside triphosphate hydrolase protein n=1 Tax=Staphylotrichum tortipilum TaxID=2831512 RepID=A0AAN6RUW1_9PEZI|nr:P-loop containing nucleoside triphosphate hydrolase protein [Staphylotrichum longicolle]
MDGLSLAILLVLGCPGDAVKLKPAPAALPALHPLRRRPNTRRPRTTDALHLATATTPTPLITTTTAPGALLLSSYLLVHLLLPRMRLLNNMDPSAENAPFRSGLRAPQIRPPSTVQLTSTVSATSHLQPMTDSQHNARAQITGIPQKRTHHGSISLPDSKRKTLVEKAAEPLKSGKGLPRAAMGVKGASIMALSSNHPAAATTSRYAPASNFSKTVGPGARPPQPPRAPTSMGFTQSTTTRPRGHTRARPATAMANRDVEDDVRSPDRQSKGTAFSQVTQRFGLRNPTLRANAPQQQAAAQARPASREISGLSRRFETLSLEDPPNKSPNGCQAASKLLQDLPLSRPSQSDVIQTESPAPKSNTSNKNQTQNNSSNPPREEAARSNPFGPAHSRGTPARPPATPPPLQKFNGALEAVQTLLRSPCKRPPSPVKSCTPIRTGFSFLTKDSNLTSYTGASWDVDDRLTEFESQFKVMKEAFEGTMTDRKTLEEAIDLAKNRASDLEREQHRLVDQNTQLQAQLDAQRQEHYTLQQEKQSMVLELEASQRRHKYDLEDRAREHKHQLDEAQRGFHAEIDTLKREQREALAAMERHYRAELADEQARAAREATELRARLGSEQQDLNLALLKREREAREARADAEAVKADLERERDVRAALQRQADEMGTAAGALEARMRGLRAKIDFLESDSKQQSDSFASMEARLREALAAADDAREKLMREETERRVLFNKYQELKGNIRVMCRVRPVLDEAEEGEAAGIAFPDTKTSSQIDVTGPEEKSSLGAISRKVLPFEFDRVFSPGTHNEDVFGEISQLVQSALDGYNVCIFCYGQTGSGKTYTMSSADGMIPRATHMIYDTITKLREKSWTYSMEGSFVEVYNEELHDLLAEGRSSKKLEVRHDEARKQTTVANCRSVALDSADRVEAMLRQAQGNRSVAATKANERSSRSHSVFILRLAGENSATGERCEGTLNLVDLAGSERLKHSQAEGERMRETQSINKSLACLGDVIEALGRGSAHVPYRNSKLTHLLQYSLGGNSKTLMFVMVSPLEAHLKETITSLRFATKVHNTHIGTAKSTKKLRASTPESNR